MQRWCRELRRAVLGLPGHGPVAKGRHGVLRPHAARREGTLSREHGVELEAAAAVHEVDEGRLAEEVQRQPLEALLGELAVVTAGWFLAQPVGILVRRCQKAELQHRHISYAESPELNSERTQHAKPKPNARNLR